MKNQYVGDVNDFLKYGLLRGLMKSGAPRLLVAWMLTPDDGSTDGRFRDYLQKPHDWRHFDPALYDCLSSLSVEVPDVSLVESSRLLPRCDFFSSLVPDAREPRERWFKSLVAAAHTADLIFLDPDTGIEIASKPVGRKNSSKYVLWAELEQLWESNKSILIYQHFPHKKRSQFSQRIAGELRDRTGARIVHCFRTRGVLFLLACQEAHATELALGAKQISHQWLEQIAVEPAA